MEAPRLHSYARSYAIGHGAIKELFFDDVIVEEKIDGSQFSFGVFGGELKCRSKGAVLNLIAPDQMFKAACETATLLMPKLVEGWTYRCEYLQKPKHNTLAYERVPNMHVIGFDINTGNEIYLSYDEKRAEFERIGLECVPILFSGRIENPGMLRDLLNLESILGKQKIEGVVVKNYKRFTIEGKVQMGKFVSEEFKEVHTGDWRERNPGNGEIKEVLGALYRTPARWQKAVQHLKEAGSIEGDPRDIGKLIAEVPKDLRKECEEEIKQKLFEWAWPQIARMSTHGLPQWYKEKLLVDSFDKGVE